MAQDTWLGSPDGAGRGQRGHVSRVRGVGRGAAREVLAGSAAVCRGHEPPVGRVGRTEQRVGEVVAGAVEAPVRLVLACHLLPQRLTRGLPRLCV